MTHDNTTNNAPLDASDYQAPFDVLQANLDDFKDATIDTESAAELNDLIKSIKSKAKEADTDRLALKKPHADAANMVQSAFNVVRDRAAIMAKQANALLTPFLVEQRRIAEEAEQLAREEAERKAKIAQALEDDEFAGEQAAQEAARAASVVNLKAVETETAGRAGSASGTSRTASLRTSYKAEIVDYQAAAKHFASHPAVQEAIIKLAEAAMRSDRHKATVIPGVQFNKQYQAA